jgi:hypothetical protein
MNRWHARLAELHRAAIRFPDGVQNVQNVQNTLADATCEQFEHSEQRSDDCKGRSDTGQERAVVEWPNPHRPRAGQTVEPSSAPFAKTLAALERRCPDHVPVERWRQAVEDWKRFLSQWGEQAEALGWTSRDLFGLHTPPATPHPSYSRLSRYDATGLVWLLRGRPVVALTEATAAIQGPTGAITVYRRYNKPALGPLGDSLDDFEPPFSGDAA